MDKYYYLTDTKQQMGPVAPEDFKAYGITADTYIWREGMPDWIKVSQVPSLMNYIVPVQQCQSTRNTLPPTNLALAILTTLFCCLPTGIYAIVRACQVENYWHNGLFMEAEKASKDAKKWSYIGAILSIIGWVLYCLFTFIVFGLYDI